MFCCCRCRQCLVTSFERRFYSKMKKKYLKDHKKIQAKFINASILLAIEAIQIISLKKKIYI